MQLDPRAVSVLCLEEPEKNGIHPERINSMVTLLEDMASDCENEADETNHAADPRRFLESRLPTRLG